MVGSVRSGDVGGVPGSLRVESLVLLIFLLYRTDLPMLLKNTIVCYDDYSILLLELFKPNETVPVVSSLNFDHVLIDEWSKCWDIMVNSI